MQSSVRHEIAQDTVRLDGLGARWALIAFAAAVVGWVASAGLAFGVEGGLERFMRSYLVSFSWVLSIAVGGLFFVLISHLTRAGWSVVLRRIAEVLSLAFVPLAVMALVIFFGRDELYPWTDSEWLAADKHLAHKVTWFSPGFFGLRLVVYFAVWTFLATWFHGRSVRQDETGDMSLTTGMESAAAPGMILFALTVTYGSFDLLMSLDPKWYSTIYGVYFFGGSTLAAFCTVTVITHWLRGKDKLTALVGEEHYHDLGKLMFAFVVFWAYIGFSQYMLIWYAHIPEETEWYQIRQEGPWGAASLFLLFGHFVVPFLWLMSRHIKRRPTILFAAALWLLGVHWFDLYWLVMPQISPDRIPFHLLDLTTLVAVAGVAIAWVLWRLDRNRIVAVGDPRLAESLELENV